MPFNYHSEQINSKDNGTRRNIVSINNGKGTKSVEEYDTKGKLLHTAKKPLTSTQIQKIKNNSFIPGLFNDCCASKQTRSKTRRVNRRRN